MNNTIQVSTDFKKTYSVFRMMVSLILLLISALFSQAQVTPSVVITSSAINNSICRGTAVTFTATPTNGGSTPTYQWKCNGANVGASSAITLNNLQNNDQITVVMTTSLSAASVTNTTATSNAIALTVNNLPSVVSTTPATISSCTSTGSATINAVPTTGSVIDWYASTSSITPLLTSSNSYTTPNISSTTTYYPVARDTVTGCQSNVLTSQNMHLNMGPNTAYVQTTRPVTGSFTIEFWLKTAGSSSAGCQSWRCGEGLVDANTGDASDRDFGITMYNDYVAFGMGNGTGNPDVSIVTTTLINNRRWKHIAASWDSTTGAMKLYVNGNLEASAIGGLASRNGQTAMRVGALLQAPSNGFYGYYSGSLDEVRVWRKVRTQAEIQSNYTNLMNGKEDGLALYYNFNQGINNSTYNTTQTTLYDITPNGYNGTLTQFLSLGGSGGQGSYVATFDNSLDPAKYPVVVTKIPLPTVTSTTGATICGSGTTVLSASASSSAKIDWYANASGGTALASGTANFTTPTLSVTTSYYAEARDTVTGCVSVSRTAVISTVNGLPTATITNNTGSTELTCARTSISVSASGGSTYSWNNSLGVSRNVSITSPGTYIVTVTGANSCNSTSSITVTQNITLPIAGITNNTGATLLNCSRTTISVTATGGSTYTWNNNLGTSANASIAAPGTYTVTVRGSNGCTSTANIATTQNIAISRTDTTAIVCNSFVWYGTTYTNSSTPTHTFTNINGCDSIVTLRLTIVTPTTSTETVAACLNYTWNGTTYTTSGTKTWIGTNAVGCDSVVTLNLTIIKRKPYPPFGVIQSVVSKVCSSRVYRYTASVAPAGDIYNWILPTSIGGVSGVTVDSGDINSSRSLLVRYTSNEAAFTTDSIKVRKFNGCASKYTAIKLSINKLSIPIPASILVTSIDANACSNRKYRFTAPALPAGTNSGNPTFLPATGYLWSFVGSLSEFATIDSGDENSQKIVVSFSTNTAAITGDSIKLQYLSGCGYGIPRAIKLSNTKLNAPLAPSSINITALQTNVCGERKYRYTAPNLPLSTTNYGAANGYVWSLVGSLSGTATIDSGNVNSQTIVVTFTSNAAAATGDSIRLNYTSDCGNGTRKASKLTNTLLGAPSAPASITIQTKSNECNARTYRYIAPVLPLATTSVGAATGYLWSAPTGTVGSTGTIDSGDVNSRIITVTYSSNAAATAGDSIRLLYTSLCGDGKTKAQRLSNLVKNGCTPIAKISSTSRVPTTVSSPMEVNVYPNPTTSQFNVQVKSSSTEAATVRILDFTGRFIKAIKVSSNSNVNIGSDLKAGSYMLEVRQGKEVKMVRVVKF